MLANLDNEVHFKNVFTNVEIFRAFVKDVLGIEMNIKQVETEKVLMNQVSAIKFKMDLFAEDEEARTIVEIQKVDYDYSYDRFAHYFLGNLIGMQRSSRHYAFAKQVYVIVVVTSAYRISDKNGQPIKETVLITDINPRNLQNKVIEMHDHKMVILNTEYYNADTPEGIKDWLDLIRESMTNPEKPNINKQKEAIVKAAQLAEIDLLSPEQLADAKIQEMRKATLALAEDMAKEKGRAEGIVEGIAEGEVKQKNKSIIKALKRGKLTKEEIAEDFEVTLDYVLELEKTLD